MAEARFRKSDRIRLSRDYARIKESGKRFRTRHFLLNYQRSDGDGIRLGTVVSSRVRPAHKRNRCKRLIREYFRMNRSEIKGWFEFAWNHNGSGLDLVVVAYPGAEGLSFGELKQELNAGLEQEAGQVRKR